MPNPKRQARLDATYYTHRALWQATQDLTELAEENPERSRALHVATLLLLHNCFEAYLNHVIEELLPAVWKDHRAYFSRGRHRGVMGKLNRICDELKIDLDRRCRPYRTVRELNMLRNKLVHAQTEKQTKLIEFTDTRQLLNLESLFFKQVTSRFVARAVTDVEAVGVKVVVASRVFITRPPRPARSRPG